MAIACKHFLLLLPLSTLQNAFWQFCKSQLGHCKDCKGQTDISHIMYGGTAKMDQARPFGIWAALIWALHCLSGAALPLTSMSAALIGPAAASLGLQILLQPYGAGRQLGRAAW